MLATTLMLLLGLLALALPVAAAMGVLGMLLDQIYSSLPLTLALGEVAWSTSKDFLLVAMPLFILLGEMLLRSGVAERMYGAMAKWMSWLPGGLMHSNIGACALFAATSGSCVATAATVGTVALPQVRALRLQRAPVPRHAGCRRHARHPDPAVDQHDHLRGADQHLDPEALPRRHHSGPLLALLFMAMVLGLCLLRPAWGGRR